MEDLFSCMEKVSISWQGVYTQSQEPKEQRGSKHSWRGGLVGGTLLQRETHIITSYLLICQLKKVENTAASENNVANAMLLLQFQSQGTTMKEVEKYNICPFDSNPTLCITSNALSHLSNIFTYCCPTNNAYVLAIYTSKQYIPPSITTPFPLTFLNTL